MIIKIFLLLLVLLFIFSDFKTLIIKGKQILKKLFTIK